jgi:hypothetical protein
MLAGESGFLRTRDPWKDRPAWIAYAPVPNGQFSLAVVYPEDEALAEARQLRNELLITGLVGLLGLLGALIFIARTGSKPIVELARAAQLVADGDLEQRLSVTAPTSEVRNLAHVNDELCEQSDSGMVVSVLYAHLNTRTGAVEFCNAGHPVPYLLGSDNRVRPLYGEKDVAIGAMSALDYHITKVQLTPGDTLFFYTDGVTEAMDRSDRFYSNARLECVLSDVGTLSVEKITRGVVRDVRTFSGEREQNDDISVMALRWMGPAQ